MDLTTRKYRFIEQIMKIRNSEKIELLEQFMAQLSIDDDVVGYTPKGQPLTIKAYKAKIKKSEQSLDDGAFLTQQDIESKFLGGL
ncbi:MAG: hypothetical protein N4A45_10900 [Flavobacteriales bacterium]|jgi:hypothetical protein|nr:hypothetical protein [Flavobacteriales bacterium]